MQQLVGLNSKPYLGEGTWKGNGCDHFSLNRIGWAQSVSTVLFRNTSRFPSIVLHLIF
jgi:hypothetical protein